MSFGSWYKVYTRQHGSVVSEIEGISRRMADVENNRQLDSNLLEEVLNMTRNIYQTYQNAPDFMKQLYLRFFFERIEIKNKKVSKYIATPTFQALMKGHHVLKLKTQLPLLDLFRNQKIEINVDLCQLKYLFGMLNLPQLSLIPTV